MPEAAWTAIGRGCLTENVPLPSATLPTAKAAAKPASQTTAADAEPPRSRPVSWTA